MIMSFPGRTIPVLVCFFLTFTLSAKTFSAKSKRKPSAIEQNAEPSPSPGPEPSASPETGQGENTRKLSAAPNATLPAGQLIEFSTELPRVRKLIQDALALTTLNLTYTANSDDPANGGMDCSGFTAYLLRQNGFPDVPRDASGQYTWLRKAGTFRAVLSHNQETFELDDLHPGDLLFWMGTYVTSHDPPVTHVMIYLGTDKETKNRIMAGSSDGRTYQGKSRWGVSVFDFHLSDSPRSSESKSNHSIFVGYAHLPGLRD
jgi:cell wall-associated NlpC family hydrolase